MNIATIGLDLAKNVFVRPACLSFCLTGEMMTR
jgi:hypothetical protein